MTQIVTAAARRSLRSRTTTGPQRTVRKQHADPFGGARGKKATATIEDRGGNGILGDRGNLDESDDTIGGWRDLGGAGVRFTLL